MSGENAENRREMTKKRAPEIRALITPAFTLALLRTLKLYGIITLDTTTDPPSWHWDGVYSENRSHRKGLTEDIYREMRSQVWSLGEHSTSKIWAAILICLSEEGLGMMVRALLESMPYYDFEPEVYVVIMENGLLMGKDLDRVSRYATRQREIINDAKTTNNELAQQSEQLVKFIDALVASDNIDLAVRVMHSFSVSEYAEMIYARGPELLTNAGSPITNLPEFFTTHIARPAFLKNRSDVLFGYLSVIANDIKRRIVSIPSLLSLAHDFNSFDEIIGFLKSYTASRECLTLDEREKPIHLNVLEACIKNGFTESLIARTWRLFVPHNENATTVFPLLIQNDLAKLPIIDYNSFTGDLTPCFKNLVQNGKAHIAAAYFFTIHTTRGKNSIPDSNAIVEMIVNTGDQKAIEMLMASIPSAHILKQAGKIDWDNRPGSLKLSYTVARAMSQLDVEKTLALAYHLDPEAVSDVIVSLTEKGDLRTVVNQLENLHGLSRAVALVLDEAGFSYQVLIHRKNFKALTSNDLKMLMIASMKEEKSATWANAMINALDSFYAEETLPLQLFEMILDCKYGNLNILVTNLSAFQWPHDVERSKALGKRLIRNLVHAGALQEIDKVRKFFNTNDEVYGFYLNEFGDDIQMFNEEFYKIMEAVFYDTVQTRMPDYAVSLQSREVGVTSSGKQGVQQFISSYRKTRQRLIDGRLTFAELDNAVIRKFVKHMTRFGQSEWDDGDEDDEFEKIIDSYKVGAKELPYGRRTRLKKTYGSRAGLKTYAIRKQEKSEKKKEFSKTFLERWNMVLSAIRSGYGAWKETASMGETSGMKQLLKQIEMKQSAMMKTLLAQEASYANGTHPNKDKILFNIRLRITALGKIQTQGEFSAQNAPEILDALSLFGNEFASETLSLATYFALFMHPMAVAEARNIPVGFSYQDPTEEQISWVINFLNHTVGTETVGKLFSEGEARANFANFLRTGALEEGLANFSSNTKGTTKVSFVADQGLLMQFSGHMGDACWTGERAHSHPNKFAIAMIQNYGEGSKHERLVGSALMIEADSQNGDKMLIIRGLNPRENLITRLDVIDFFNTFVSYARGLAKASGRVLAITIDDHSGGSGTNRPLIHAHMMDLKKTLRKARPATARNTTFNGYNITNQCFYL